MVFGVGKRNAVDGGPGQDHGESDAGQCVCMF